jgi:hypothetical protein
MQLTTEERELMGELLRGVVATKVAPAWNVAIAESVLAKLAKLEQITPEAAPPASSAR